MYITNLSGLCFAMSLVITGCSANTETEDFILLPPLFISCSQASSLDCAPSSAGKKFYVGLLDNISSDCETELLKAQGNTFHHFFNFSSSGTTTFTGELEGEILEWRNTENQEAFYMKKVNYKACAFLDMDDDRQLDPTEVVGELIFNYNVNQPTIIDWY